MNRLEHAREVSVWVDISRSTKTNSAPDSSSQVGDDVAKQVVGNNHVEALRVGNHEDSGGVDVKVVNLHARVFLCNKVNCVLPKPSGVDQNVVLVNQS